MYVGTPGSSTAEAVSAPTSRPAPTPEAFIDADRYYTRYREGMMRREIAITLLRDTLGCGRGTAAALLDDENNVPSNTYTHE